ncbi:MULTISPECIES: phage tail assembly chaperone [Pseudomonas]|jgi:hypothetical protein|uniref:phage tail assembly chaperone n=1 Tax=Pseudomonas TaxID=286 RepID=UPI001F26D3E1|nr:MULTISPECIES: phage tail assembly chaperone [Pseudomonas]MCO7505441.1 phage tail assembly chaperone [Pseudomonas sp. VE 267-6A]MCO7528691.1 phage tail assembly chaperone [Pseudomonas sp. 2]
MWARIEDGVVLEVTDLDPTGRFHPSMTWMACDARVTQGWQLKGDILEAPVAAAIDLSAIERSWRDRSVNETEWLVTRHRDERELKLNTTLTSVQFAELLVYRQSLRDWPQSTDFPKSEHRPPELSWLAEQI